jgi:simple sugar transport system permease protein
VFVPVLGLFSPTAPNVFSRPDIHTTFPSTLPPSVLLAVGLTSRLGAGEIDLSFPAVIALPGIVFAVLFYQFEIRRLAVPIGLASGPPLAVATGPSGGGSDAPAGAAGYSARRWQVGRSTLSPGGLAARRSDLSNRARTATGSASTGSASATATRRAGSSASTPSARRSSRARSRAGSPRELPCCRPWGTGTSPAIGARAVS